MSSRKGSALKCAAADAEQVAGTKDIKLRYSTIRCGINPLRSQGQYQRLREEGYADTFKTIAHSIGAYRHVVTLVSNCLVLRDQTLPECGWHVFYYRVWSAVERVQKHGSKRKGRADYCKLDNMVESILEDHSIACMPEAVNVDLRMQEAATMATQTAEYLRTFYDRMRRKLNVQIASLCTNLGWEQIDSITRKVVNYVFCSPSVETTLRRELAALVTVVDVDSDVHQAIEDVAREERENMGSLVTETRDGKSWLNYTKDDELYKLLPHMLRISSWSEQWLRDHFGDTTSERPLSEESGDHAHERDDDDGGARRRWSKRRLPKPFSALPISKLQAAMVLYTATEVKAMMEVYYPTSRSTKKRKKGAADGDGASAKAESIEEYYERRFGVNNFGDVIFDMRSFKGRNGPYTDCHGATSTRASGTNIPKWTIASFRTDGTSASVTFVSGVCPPAFNTDNLFKKGYNFIAKPLNKVEVYDPGARGLYFVGEYKKGQRNDIEAVDECLLRSKPLRITAVDPGFCKPVHYATVYTDVDDPMTGAHHAYVTEDEWMHRSGRQLRRDAEDRRVKTNVQYGKVINNLRKCGGRKSATKCFVDYFGMMLGTFEIRFGELVCEARSKLRWNGARRQMQFVSQLCDKLFDRSTLRFTRREKLDPWSQVTSKQSVDCVASVNDAKCATSERACLRRVAEAELHEKRTKRRSNPKSLVFFGDATFGPSMRGHNSIPKKGILRALSHRGLTFLLDEHRTSMQCPCGEDELTTMAGRNRAHKSDGASCSLLEKLGDCDRDALASLNMIQCALCAIRGAMRPPHLCRSKSSCSHQEGLS